MPIDLSQKQGLGLLLQFRKQSLFQTNAGFTLIELVAVTLLVGILSAIAAPSWITFTNQRRVNAANDAILRALQTAQQEAKRTKLSYSVSFKTEDTPEGKIPQVAIYSTPATDTTGTPPKWENLGKDLGLRPGQVVLGTNLTAENTADSSLDYGANTLQTITFNYLGNLPPAPATNLGSNSQGLIVSVAVPEPNNSTKVLEASRRCVKVKTLLGAIQIGRGDECNAQ
ncbi:MAG: type II secretion system GspH family protein [Gloeocapsa sp. UFS-A4-WI-NPMV-4B04]|jgi:prepilin-type N-terminal cleavage/methylation domain-containing protein|nr:type II secretion system GspH family protein [Gloeocapsa sp. UFS-A4-WI-NPMV-4B04]